MDHIWARDRILHRCVTKKITSCSEGVNRLWLWIECGAFLVAHDVDTAWVILRSHLAQLDIWFRKSRFSSPHANAFSPLANHFKNVKKSENPNDWKFLPETKLFCSKHFNICLNNDSCVIEREKKRKIRTCGALWTTQRSESVKNPSGIRWERPPKTLKLKT